MKVIVIIDKYVDEREFRNYSTYWLSKLGFKNITIDDPSLNDEDSTNNNDFKATKRNKEYTIQTFLNQNITEKEVEETLIDMEKEHVENGIIVTNKEVSEDFIKYAKEKKIEIIDRSKFTEDI